MADQDGRNPRYVKRTPTTDDASKEELISDTRTFVVDRKTFMTTGKLTCSTIESFLQYLQDEMKTDKVSIRMIVTRVE